MGVLTDFIAASPTEIRTLEPGALPAETLDTFQAKGVDTVKVDLLVAALTGRPLDQVLDCGELVGEPAPEGPWIFRLPGELKELLAGLDPSDLDGLAERWSTTEDFDGWRQDEVLHVLRELVAIAGRAHAEGKNLYHWVCV